LAWVSVHQTIEGHKLRGLKKAVGCSECEAIGILTKLWLWGLDNTDKSGEILNADREDIADLLTGSLSPKLKPLKIVEALITERWIDDTGGRLYLHDWPTWQSYWFDYRERLEKDRLRKKSGKQCGNSEENPRKLYGNSGDIPAQPNLIEPTPDINSHEATSPLYPRKGPDATEPFTGTSKDEPDGEQTSSEAEATGKQKQSEPFREGPDTAEAPADKSDPVPYTKIMELYNRTCASFPKIQIIDGSRRKAVGARFKTYGNIDVFRTLFEKTEASSFLKGNNDRNWRADFDWLMKPNNTAKVLEGKYDDKGVNTHAGNRRNNEQSDSGPRDVSLTGFHMATGDDDWGAKE
jgi:hypothetical protein